jgi:Fe2+ or Zn2+ uptake regulation protein
VLDGWFYCDDDDDDDDDDDHHHHHANCISSGTCTEYSFSISSMQVKQNHG